MSSVRYGHPHLCDSLLPTLLDQAISTASFGKIVPPPLAFSDFDIEKHRIASIPCLLDASLLLCLACVT